MKLLTLFAILAFASLASAQSPTAYEHANENAAFKRGTSSQQQVITVPDTGSTAILMALAGAGLLGLSIYWRRQAR